VCVSSSIVEQYHHGGRGSFKRTQSRTVLSPLQLAKHVPEQVWDALSECQGGLERSQLNAGRREMQRSMYAPSGDHVVHHTRSVWPSSVVTGVREDMAREDTLHHADNECTYASRPHVVK
jgi:hypothetical protein